GLLDPKLMSRRKAQDEKLRAAVAKDPKLKDALGAWDKIAAAEKVRAQHARDYNMLEGAHGFTTDLFGIARTILRAAEEKEKPNGERLREYNDSNLESLEDELFSPAPIYDNYEIVKLTDALTFLAGQLGDESPIVKKVLAGKAPHERALELIKGT